MGNNQEKYKNRIHNHEVGRSCLPLATPINKGKPLENGVVFLLKKPWSLISESDFSFSDLKLHFADD